MIREYQGDQYDSSGDSSEDSSVEEYEGIE
jgi:hypothetical protein